MTLYMIDLFAGTGAFSLAFVHDDVQVVYANDSSPYSKKAYDANHPLKLDLQDLNQIDVTKIPPHDILTGGFPCQPFSIAGHQAGFNDERSNVFWKILEIVDYHHPRCLVLENVKNLLTHDDKQTFQRIKDELTQRGYNLTYKILNTATMTGIPQHRERLYIVAFRDPIQIDQLLDFPVIPKRPIQDFLDPIVSLDTHSKYYYTESSRIFPLLQEAVVDTDKIYQYRRVYVRENKSHECPTLTANMGTGGHNVPIIRVRDGIRKLTPRECFNFQGFPADYILPDISDAQLYKLVGNAVSVPVVQKIAKQIVDLLQI
jgi:DNA (cytosine-5)-methyltransferase 1